MRLDELRDDAELLRGAGSPSWPAPLAEATEPFDLQSAPAANDAPPDEARVDVALTERLPTDDTALPLPPPPPSHARAGRWTTWLAQFAQRPEATSDTPLRQRNPAPWLALALMVALLIALGAGLLRAQRVGEEAERTMESKRQAAERAVGLLGGPAATPSPGPADGESRSAMAQAPASGPALAAMPAAPVAEKLPPSGAERHEAMLEAIRSGALLTTLQPAALAQPSPLPADWTGPRGPAPRAEPAPLPPKKVALAVEGAPSPPRAADPLASAAVAGALKGSAVPLHRVYQLRESEGEWLGYVARAEDDPLAAGVWAGAGDLLAGGWRVAEVTAQRLTLVGPRGALEILRP
jgi:hypothetical protein